MKSAARFCLVLVTVPTLKSARSLARGALEQRLAACVNIVPGLESHYTWKGKRDSASELLLIFKSRKSKLPALESFVKANHSYETPEFIVLSLAQGNAAYLNWLAAETS